MRFIPAIFIVLSFITICIGAYLRSQGYAAGNFIIVCGLIGEIIFILFNRMLFAKSRKKQ